MDFKSLKTKQKKGNILTGIGALCLLISFVLIFSFPNEFPLFIIVPIILLLSGIIISTKAKREYKNSLQDFFH